MVQHKHIYCIQDIVHIQCTSSAAAVLPEHVQISWKLVRESINVPNWGQGWVEILLPRGRELAIIKGVKFHLIVTWIEQDCTVAMASSCTWRVSAGVSVDRQAPIGQIA